LLPAVEEGLVVLIGATTENPFFAVNSPLLSRATLWRLEPLGDDDVAEVIRRGLEAEGSRADDEAVTAMVAVADGDARAALGTLEVAVALAGESPSPPPSSSGPERAGCCTRGPTPTTTGERADQVDPGSDPDAALYWFARMLEGGEDARFIARRLVILASEDVGLADPLALVVADAAARAVEFVGLPRPSSTWLRPSSTWRVRPNRTGSPQRWRGPVTTPATGLGPMSPPTCVTPTTGGPPTSGTARVPVPP